MLYLPINHIKAFSKTKPSITTTSFSSFFTLKHKLDNKPDKVNSNVLIHFFRTQYFSSDLSHSGCC